MKCSYCNDPAVTRSEVKLIGGAFRLIDLCEDAASIDKDCLLKARRGYPVPYRDPITDAERYAMTDISFGPKGWMYGDPQPEYRTVYARTLVPGMQTVNHGLVLAVGARVTADDRTWMLLTLSGASRTVELSPYSLVAVTG